jgi:hypothetical protein
LVQLFRDGGYQGRIIHSAETACLEDNVRGKRILLVGGGFSAEDLALQSIKLGVEKVYVSTRLGDSEVTWTTSWPMEKVEVLREQEPLAVTENGSCIQFHEVEWTLDGYKSYGENVVESEIRDIDTVILCTGYDVHLDFLDESLRKGYPGGEDAFNSKFTFKAPEDWRMPHGLFSELTGEVELSSRLRYLTSYVHPEFFRGVLISNPNMMFLSTYGSDHPLLAIDTYVWLLARYVTGLVEMPPQDEMRRLNLEEAIDMLKYPYLRYQMDENYYKAVTYLPNFWSKDGYEYPQVWGEGTYENEILATKRLAWMMREANYPVSIGTRYELNEKALALLDFGEYSYNHRHLQDKANANENMWKTFRDYNDGNLFYSLFTGTEAVSLKQRWLDADTPSENEVDTVSKI